MMESEDNIKKYLNTNIVDIKNENKFKLYQISLFPNFQENIINFPSLENEKNDKQLQKKNQNNNNENKKTNKKNKQSNQNKPKKKKTKSKNNVNKIYNLKKKSKKNIQILNHLNENLPLTTNDLFLENNYQNEYENCLINQKLNKTFGNLNSSNKKKYPPMINGNESNNINKSMYEYIEKLNGNIPYNNIGGSQIKNDNQINKINYNLINENYDIQKNVLDKESNTFLNQEFNQINLNKDISNDINENILLNYNPLDNNNNQIYYNCQKDVYDKKFQTSQNNTFFTDKIKININNFYNNNNINKNINNDNIGLNFSKNNKINNILHSSNNVKHFNYDFKINNTQNDVEKIINNVNKNGKKYIFMSDILSNIHPEINYGKYKEHINKQFIKITIKNNNNEDINYYLYENDNPINFVGKIVKDNNIKLDKIPLLLKRINNGINFIKNFNSYNLEYKSIKDLIMLKNKIYDNNMINDSFNN